MTSRGRTTRRGQGSGALRFGGGDAGPVLIVGAGITGLATAVALARRGIPATVLERAVELGEVGAGIQVTPNGMAVLRALGLADAVRAAGLAAEAVELRRAEDGRRVVRMGLAGRDWVLVHRARLLEALADAARAADVAIETGVEVASVTDGPEAASLTLADGIVRRAPLVVGADGLRGTVRLALGQADAPRFTGQTAWRALVPGEGPAVAEVHMAPGRHVVTYPLAGGLRNLVAVEARRDWTAEGWSIRGEPDELRRRFRGFSPRLVDMLSAVEDVHLWGLHRHPVAPGWHGRRVVIAGDAAHPTLPFLAQGANMGLEDAWALADCLATLPMDRALAAYQSRRRARTARIVAAASGNAWVYHMPRGPQRWALHTGLGLMERVRPGGAISRFDWIYRHDETRVGTDA